MLCASIGVHAQEEFLSGDRMAVFYPADFDSTQTLASFAIQKELTRQGDVPSDWEIRPVFKTDDNGKTLVEIAYSDNVDLYGTGLVNGNLRRNGYELINGHDDGTLEPGSTTTRAQAASILMRFDQKLIEE